MFRYIVPPISLILESTSPTSLRAASSQDPTKNPKRRNPNRRGGKEKTNRNRNSRSYAKREGVERYCQIAGRGGELQDADVG